LDRPLYIWNKDNTKHLFIEVDSSDEGWGACAYQYADSAPPGEDEGKHFLLSKRPKRIIQWISKAWTPYEKKSLPIFYKETIARILTLEQFRNLIETQALGSGTTCYSDHLPGIKSTSLSNKGKLSTWKLHETSDLTSTVTTLYKSGPTMAIADPLSRLSRQEHRVDNLDLPLLLEILLSELPDDIRKLERFCVNAEKDTNVATRIVQRWRTLSNPISNTIGGSEGTDFLIAAPYADKLPLKVAEYIRQDVPFAILVPLSLLNEIERVGKNEVDELIRSRRLRMKLVISSSLGQAWLINHPSCRMDTSTHSVFFTETPNDLDQLVIDAIDRLMTGGMTHEHDAFATLTPREMRAKRRGKERQTPTDQSKGQDVSTANQSDQSESEKDDNANDSPSSIIRSSNECQRTINHPLHTISMSPKPLPIDKWAPLQNPKDIPSNMVRVPKEELKKGMPDDLIVLRDRNGRKRILVPKSQRIALTQTEHETMLHVKGNRVSHELSRSYFWPKMTEEIKEICKACKICQEAEVHRKNLSATFRQADEKDLPLPRQAYGIDFYGHEKGEILVAVDLCTREATLWFLPNRKQENVARALMTGLILQKGVPLIFRNDEASEFVNGAVAAMNRYLGITQVTTGSYNPRSNAVVERFMQHLNGCLTKCDDTQYNNIRDYLPAIAFAHNTSFNSAINCTPFEAGHGLQARTITEARAGPRLQIVAEGGMDISDSDKTWEKSIFPKVYKLAERLASEAQRHSQWHKRMNAHNLNQSGAKVEEKGFSPGDRVYFYRPPTRQEIAKRGRKAKHLAHYHGPAIVQGNVEGRDRQYHITYDGKQFKRDISMLIPERTIKLLDVFSHDPTAEASLQSEPALLKPGVALQEEELILCKTDKDDKAWYLAEVYKIYPDEIEVIYYTTPREQLDEYESANHEQRKERLSQCRFRKTWFMRTGTNAGKGTINAPFPKNPSLRLWKGKLPMNEFEHLILANGIKLDHHGYLTKESLKIASQVTIPHEAINTIEDEKEIRERLQASNAMFSYAELMACNCNRCQRIWTETAKEDHDINLATAKPRPS
jgi:transposase InsO family protein